MTEPSVQYRFEAGVARLVLDRPGRRNALSTAMLDDLNRAADRAAGEPRASVCVLCAEGPAFCAGMDLKTVALDNPAEAARFADALGRAYRRLITLPMPLFTAVDGPAMGGAVGLALAGDLVWVGPEASIAFPETRVGVVPAYVSVVARRRIAPGRLAGLALTGLELDAEAAVRMGLADFASVASAREDALDRARSLVRENSNEAMRRARAFLTQQFTAELDRELADARREFLAAVATNAARRGLDAFRQKKPLVWHEPSEEKS